VNASATAVARTVGIALVLILAATFGLVIGNLISLRDTGASVGAGAHLPHMGGFDGARYAQIQPAAMRGFDWAQFHVQQGDVAGLGAPAYADPYRQIVEEADDAERSTESLTVPTPR
jgi:hypothetical protein